MPKEALDSATHQSAQSSQPRTTIAILDASPRLISQASKKQQAARQPLRNGRCAVEPQR